MRTVYSEAATKSAVFKWHQMFKKGRDVKDDGRSRHSKVWKCGRYNN